MHPVLLAIVDVLLIIAIVVQAAYLRGMRNSGVQVTRATKVVSYFNIALLALLLLGLTALGVANGLGIEVA